MVKSCGSTVELPLILISLNVIEVGGMSSVAVKCLDITQNTDCEGSYQVMIDAEARKRGDRTGLDTLVVHAVNGVHSLFAIYSKRPSESIK